MATNVYGIEAVEYAPVSVDGTLPATGWIRITPISDDAVTFAVPAVAVTKIRAQDISGIYEILPGDTEPVTMAFQSLNVDGVTVAALLGGVWTSATKTYDAPIVDVIKKYAFRITSKPLNGNKLLLSIKNAAVYSNVSAQFVRNDLFKIGFNIESLAFFNGTGVPVSPWGFQVVAVA